MAIPPPPTTSSFTKKTWNPDELIPSIELNRIENALDDFFHNNIELAGNKTFDESLWLEFLDYNGQGKIWHDGTDLIFESFVDRPWFFTRGNVYPPQAIIESSGLVNDVDVADHAITRHSVRQWYAPPGEPWNRTYYDKPDPTPKGRQVIVGPPGSDCDYTSINDAILHVIHGSAPWWPRGGSVFIRNGTYNEDVTLYGGCNLFGESWGARIVGDLNIYGSRANSLARVPQIVRNLTVENSGQPTVWIKGECPRAIVDGCRLINSNWTNVQNYSDEYNLGHQITNNLIIGGSGGIRLAPNDTNGWGGHLVAGNHLVDVNYGSNAHGIDVSGLYSRIINNTLNLHSTESYGIIARQCYFGPDADVGNIIIAGNYLYSYATQIYLLGNNHFVYENIMHGYPPGINDTGAGNIKVDNIAI